MATERKYSRRMIKKKFLLKLQFDITVSFLYTWTVCFFKKKEAARFLACSLCCPIAVVDTAEGGGLLQRIFVPLP